MFELKDRVAIVTGGARGIGKGITRALAAQGARVAIADLILEEAEKNASEIEREGGVSTAIQTDITDLDQVKAMVAQVKELYGPVDILVNNAGWDRIELFMKTTPDLWDRIIDINYRGILNCIYSVVDDMMSRNSGKIISISSDAGRVGSMGEAVYAGAKGAIIAFSKSLARELARYKINVNVICPGPTPTPLVEEMMEEGEFARKVLSSIDKIVPLKRMGTPEDIAHAVVFLASDEASFITGQVLSVSGGLSMV
jgi:2-hydroxycyclohexanecarboxyl-CoA dehydrogenase